MTERLPTPRRAVLTRRSKVLACALAGALICSLVTGGVKAGTASPLFADEAVLAVTLSAPWHAFRRDGDSDQRYPAELEYRTPDGEVKRIPVTVERRGLTRRSLCRFPPLRLRFDRDAAEGTIFEGQRSLKMVTHCSSSKRWEQYYVLEMLAYRIYNRVSERSFRVRSLSVTYRDSQRGRDDPDRFAFFIEHAREVARRNNMPRVREALIAPDAYDSVEMSRFMLFQYLIGNTDFSVWTGSADERCCHNMRTIGTVDGGGLYALPYDFDASGLVNAPYAAPHESLPIQRVTQRLYRGFCIHNEGLESVRNEYLELENEVLGLISAEPLLSNRNRNTALRYAREFFETLKDSNRFSRDIIRQCRK